MYYDDEQEEKLFVDLSKMINALKQQTLNPQILPFETEPFESLHKAVKEQDLRIKEFIAPDEEGNDIPSHELNFKQVIYKSETQKISYILKHYLRLRLQKIEKYAFFLIKNQSLAEKRLSSHQFVYLKKFAQIKYKYFEQNILKNLVKAYRGLGGIETYFSKINELKVQVESKQSKVQIVSPDMNQFCFAQIKTNPDLSLRYNYDIKAQNVEGEEVIASGSVAYTQYKNIKDLISEDNATLL